MAQSNCAWIRVAGIMGYHLLLTWLDARLSEEEKAAVRPAMRRRSDGPAAVYVVKNAGA